jgi:hypothetical protein
VKAETVSSARWLVWAGIAAGAVGVVLALAGISTPLRGPLVLLFLALAPATAIAGPLRRIDTFARIVVAGTASIVINFLVAETMVATGTWSPRAGLVVVIIITAICLAVQLPPIRAVLNERLKQWGAAVRRYAHPRPAPPENAPASPAADHPPVPALAAASLPEHALTDSDAPDDASTDQASTDQADAPGQADEDIDDPSD